MKTDDIFKIERVLGCELHADYKRLLYDYSPALKKMLSTEWPRNRAIYGDAKTILSVNREIRKHAGSEGYFDWSGRFLIIGGDCGGNMFYMDLKRKRSTVFLNDHDPPSSKQYAKSIQDFVYKVFETYAMLQVDAMSGIWSDDPLCLNENGDT